MAFGIEIYGPNGNTLLSMSNRVPRFAQSGSFVMNGVSNTNVNVPNMANNDSWNVFIAANSFVGLSYRLNTGFFTATNGSAANVLVSYWVVRS